jgi:hypothetical protein
MKYKIKVTRHDIKNGSTCSLNYCPIALAISRQFPNRQVHVWDTMCFLDPIGHSPFSTSNRWALPEKCIKFIYKFDMGKRVHPMVFELDI